MAELIFLDSSRACIKTIFTNTQRINSFNTHHADNFDLPSYRTTLFTKMLSFSGRKLLDMPQDVKIANPNSLKKKLPYELKYNTVYKLEEFENLL